MVYALLLKRVHKDALFDYAAGLHEYLAASTEVKIQLLCCLYRLMISDTAYNCLTKNGNAYYEYRNLHSCLSDFQNRVSVATEWYVMDNLECAEDYLRIHATLITKRMTEEADDETLAMYLNLGLLSDKDLQRTLQWASEKNMPVSVAYILDQMRKRGLKAKTELAL